MQFRRQLLDAYGGRCAVTQTPIEGLLEAAHISPYRGQHTHSVNNGLLLRSDIHTLFDLHLLSVLPDLTVRVAPEVMTAPYAAYNHAALARPRHSADRPGRELLTKHNRGCAWLGSDPELDDALF